MNPLSTNGSMNGPMGLLVWRRRPGRNGAAEHISGLRPR
jgi:hypothetical protein